ncbi:MAG: metallophosphoesterase [Lachnospiraceae bacterium]|nr:metallophosphoesterase [Lachnospiraceae bacterium]
MQKWRILLPLIFVFLTGCADGERLFPESQESIGGKDNVWEKTVTEETIFVEGLEGEYTLLFLTDTHVLAGQGDSEQEKQLYLERSPQFVSKEGVLSKDQFGAWMDYANEQEVDAVILGGDIIDVPTAVNIAFIEEQLGRLNMPYLYANGNHDWTFPWEYMTEAAKEEYLPRFKNLMPQGNDFQVLELPGLAVVAVDNSSNQVTKASLQGFKESFGIPSDDQVTMKESVQEPLPMIVVCHVPFMTQSVLGRAREVWDTPVVLGAGNYGGIYPNEISQEFVDLMTSKNSPVELVLAGHVHFYDKDVINGERDVLQIVGGAGFEGHAMLIHIKGK